jgi:hypothetical protein
MRGDKRHKRTTLKQQINKAKEQQALFWKKRFKLENIYEKNLRSKHDLNTQLYNRDFHKRKEIQKGELVLIWNMPRTNMEEGQHKKLMLPGKGPYKVTKVFKESNTVQVMTTQGQHQTANLKNLRIFLQT